MITLRNCCVVVLISLAVGTLARAADAPGKLFHLSFDGLTPLKADIAGGNPEPVLHEGGSIVPGLDGNGFHLGKTDILAYEEAGNLKKDKGSLGMWVKPQFSAAEFAEYARSKPGCPCFFKEDAPLGPLPVNNIWLWMDPFGEGNILRYDLRVAEGDVISAPSNYPLRDTWNHLLITWNCRSGTKLFVNGLDVSYFMSDQPVGVRPPLTWTPKAHPRFFVGNRGKDTYHTHEPQWGGCQSVLDEFTIYDRPLTAQEVADLYAAGCGARKAPPLFLAGRRAVLEDEPFRLNVDIKNPYATERLGPAEVRLRGDGKDKVLLSKDLQLKPGETISFTASEERLPRGTYELAYAFDGIVRQTQACSALPPLAPIAGSARSTLVASCSAADVRGTEAYRESAPANVKELEDVKYVEAGPGKFDRIAFQFEVKNPGRPHVLRLSYPDDKERVFDIIITGPSAPHAFDTQGGVLTGRELENTGTFQSYDLLYWPRETKQALILTTWAADMPAALSGFRVYELDGRLTPLPLAKTENGRHLGLYWEDPRISQCFGGKENEKNPKAFTSHTVDRMMDYMRWSGLDTLIYPIAHYEGPSVRTLAEDLFAAAGFDWHPENFAWIILRRFEEAGDFGFIPEVNVCLSRKMLEKIPEFASDPEAGYLAVSKAGQTVTGRFPRLNVLHPIYQDLLGNILTEICRQYGGSKAVKGIQLRLVWESSCWFAGSEWGYDGFTISLFRRQTGVPVPDFRDGNVYAKRYEWLVANAWERWLEWRCRKVTELLTRVAEKVRSTRKDLKLSLGLFYLIECDDRAGLWEKGNRSMKQVYREAGLDLDQVATIPNLEIQKYFSPTMIKLRRAAKGGPGNEMYSGLEFRRSDELRQVLTRNGEQSVANNLIHMYFESDIGEKKPIPDFWWACPRWRVCSLTPGGRNYLELLAESVALYDAPTITTGGFLLGTLGHNRHVQEFALAYRALPNVMFETARANSDAVVVRVGQGEWLYAVSRAPFDTEVTVSFRKPVAFTDVSNGKEFSGDSILLSLKPYELRSLRGPVELKDVRAVSCPIPVDRRALVQKSVTDLRKRPGRGVEIAAELKRELAAGNIIRCKFIMERVATLDLLSSPER